MEKYRRKQINENLPERWRFISTPLIMVFVFLIIGCNAFAQNEIVKTNPEWVESTQTIDIQKGDVVTIIIQNSENDKVYRIRKTSPLPAETITDLEGTGEVLKFRLSEIFLTAGRYTIAVRDLSGGDLDLTFTVNVTEGAPDLKKSNQ